LQDTLGKSKAKGPTSWNVVCTSREFKSVGNVSTSLLSEGVLKLERYSDWCLLKWKEVINKLNIFHFKCITVHDKRTKFTIVHVTYCYIHDIKYISMAAVKRRRRGNPRWSNQVHFKYPRLYIWPSPRHEHPSVVLQISVKYYSLQECMLRL